MSENFGGRGNLAPLHAGGTMVSLKYILKVALSVDTQIADAFLAALGAERPKREHRPRRVREARNSDPYSGMTDCFHNSRSPMDGRF